MNLYYNRTIDLVGKIMLLWFVFATAIYFYSGGFSTQIGALSNNFDLWYIYTFFQIPVAAIGIFILIPLLLKGHFAGLLLVLFQWVMGYSLNPLWYIVPKGIQINSAGKASAVLICINWFYSVSTLLILVLFYLHRRSLKSTEQVN